MNDHNLKPWKKGQSGNPKGRPPLKAIDEEFRDFLMEVLDDKGKTRFRDILENLHKQTKFKHAPATLLFNRAFGLQEQALKAEVTGMQPPIINLNLTIPTQAQPKAIEADYEVVETPEIENRSVE